MYHEYENFGVPEKPTTIKDFILNLIYAIISFGLFYVFVWLVYFAFGN